MKLVIDIDEETYKMCKRLLGDADSIERAIANGIPLSKTDGYVEMEEYCKNINKLEDDMDEDAKLSSIPYTYNAPQHDWKCGYPNSRENRYYKR